MKLRYLYPVALVAAFLILAAAAFFSRSGSTSVSQSAGTATTATATSTTVASATYTLAQIALHNSPASCYTAINGNVYDLTSFIPEHPGGDRILAVCGIDGTQAFEAQHSDNAEANAELARLKIGTLTP